LKELQLRGRGHSSCWGGGGVGSWSILDWFQLAAGHRKSPLPSVKMRGGYGVRAGLGSAVGGEVTGRGYLA
jgi:hypothetical protein